jgi:hypothetical protein
MFFFLFYIYVYKHIKKSLECLINDIVFTSLMLFYLFMEVFLYKFYDVFNIIMLLFNLYIHTHNVVLVV